MTVPQIVADASAVLAWALGEATDVAELGGIIRESSLVVPVIWSLEIVNAVLVSERRRRLSAADGTRVLESVEKLSIQLDDGGGIRLGRLAELARPHQLTAYDATYLEIAIRRGLPLLSVDRNLLMAARRSGVRLALDSPA